MSALRRMVPELRAVDAVVVVALLLMIGITGLVIGRLPASPPGLAAWVVVAGVLQTLPVLLRRERPVLALTVFCVSVPPVALAVSAIPVWTWSVLLFSVVRRTRPRIAVPTALVLTAVTVVLAAAIGTDADDDLAEALGELSVVVLPVLVVAVGLAVAARAVDARHRRGRDREERARLVTALGAQRERIAEDLRGLVAARVERLVARTRALPGEPDPDPALAAVAGEAREALAGMRRALGLLRAGTDTDDAVLPAPTPREPPSALRGWWPSRSGMVLAGLVGLVTTGIALAVAGARPGRWSPTLDLLDLDAGRPLGLAAVVVQLLALAWWRRAPLTALVVATAGSAVAATQGTTNILVETSWGILVYAAGAGAAPLLSGIVVAGSSLAVLGVTLAVGLPEGLGGPAGTGLPDMVLAYVLVPVIWGLGALQRRKAVRDDEQRRADAAQAAERAVRAERLGLARDLHDVLAHELSALVVAVHAARIEVVPSALAGIAGSGERIAAALPGLLAGGGRAMDAPAVLDAATVDGLAAGMRDAGLPVTVAVDGDPPPDRPEVDLFAGRIVTEALTNVLRHAGSTPTRVRVRHDPHAVVVEVVDAGAGPGGAARVPGSGLGLVGMRERAALLGGEVEAGPHDGGWRVRARLPRRSAEDAASQPA